MTLVELEKQEKEVYNNCCKKTMGKKESININKKKIQLIRENIKEKKFSHNEDKI